MNDQYAEDFDYIAHKLENNIERDSVEKYSTVTEPAIDGFTLALNYNKNAFVYASEAKNMFSVLGEHKLTSIEGLSNFVGFNFMKFEKIMLNLKRNSHEATKVLSAAKKQVLSTKELTEKLNIESGLQYFATDSFLKCNNKKEHQREMLDYVLKKTNEKVDEFKDTSVEVLDDLFIFATGIEKYVDEISEKLKAINSEYEAMA